MANTHVYTLKEEISHAISHGIGAALSIAGLPVLIVTAALEGTVWHVVSFSIYGAAMVLLYLSSTLVHSFPEGRAKHIFDIFDHSSIYIFIAGTYTPFLLTALRSPIGWTLFGIVWGLTLFGIVFKIFYVKKFLYLSTLLYILMGWLIVIAWKPLTAAVPSEGITLLVIGGILYSVGAIFYVWRGFQFHHFVWHLFVIASSVAHYFSILLYL